jgi:hypothetical protein
VLDSGNELSIVWNAYQGVVIVLDSGSLDTWRHALTRRSEILLRVDTVDTVFHNVA